MRFYEPTRDPGTLPVMAKVTNRRHNHAGFLLIEAVIASVILAIAAAGIVTLLLTSQQQQVALEENSTAVLLAKQLIEEIAAKPFGSSTPIVARPEMSTANQYNGYHDTTAATQTLSGETISPGDGQTYSRQVTITNAVTPTGSTAPAGDLQLVTVTVTTPSGQTISLIRLLTNVTWP